MKFRYICFLVKNGILILTMKSYGFINIFICTLFFFISQTHYAQNELNSQNSDTRKIEFYLSEARTYLDFDLDSCLILCNLAYDLALKNDAYDYQYNAARTIADCWYYKANLSKAIDYYKIAAELIKELEGEDSENYASRLSDIGYCFYEMEVNELAVNYYQDALKIFKEKENIEEISTQLNNLGTVYFNWGNYNLAIEYFSQTLTYDLERSDSSALSTSYNNIGKVYESWGHYDLAIEHYNNSISYLSPGGNQARKAIRLSNIGTTYYKKGDLDKALEFINAALEIDNQLKNPFKIAVRYNELSNIYFAKDDYEKAIKFNKEALDIFQKLNSRESLAIVLKDLGHIYLEQRKYKLAEQYFLQSIELSKEIKLLQNEMTAYRLLGEVYFSNGEYKKAILTHQKYDILKDSIFDVNSQKQLANYRIKYETVKKEQENQILKKDIVIKQRTQRTLIIIGGLLLVSLVLLVLILRLRSKTYKQDKKLSNLELEKKEIEKQHLEDKVFAEKQLNKLQRDKYEAEIQLKNQELVSSTMQLVNKNEVLTELKSKLNNSQSLEIQQKEILMLINQNIDFDQNWKRFSTEFEELNPGFFHRIRNQFPDFSEQFTRLAAFLRIDLSTKEIAQLMNVSVAAVNKNRQRLRKKLNLEPEADLTAFMKSI